MKLVIFSFLLTLSLLTKWAGAACCTCGGWKGGYANGDFYCGNRLGEACDDHKLFYCPNETAKPVELQDCGSKECIVNNGNFRYDTCAGCKCSKGQKESSFTEPNLYCGGKLNCAPNALHSCSYGQYTVHQTCQGKCIAGNGDGKDHCESCICRGPGEYCGEDIGCPRGFRVSCAGGAGTVPLMVERCRPFYICLKDRVKSSTSCQSTFGLAKKP